MSRRHSTGSSIVNARGGGNRLRHRSRHSVAAAADIGPNLAISDQQYNDENLELLGDTDDEMMAAPVYAIVDAVDNRQQPQRRHCPVCAQRTYTRLMAPVAGERRSTFWARLWLLMAVVFVMAAVGAVVATGAYDRLVPYVVSVVNDLVVKLDIIYTLSKFLMSH